MDFAMFMMSELKKLDEATKAHAKLHIHHYLHGLIYGPPPDTQVKQ